MADAAPVRHAHAGGAPVRAARPGTRRDLRLRADRVRPHPRRQRASVRGLQPAQALPRARRLRGHAGRQHHRRQRQDLRRRRARLERRARGGDDAAYIADTDRLGLGRPDHEPRASEWIDAIVEEIATLLDRGHAYMRRRRLLPRAQDPRYGTLSRRSVDAMDQGEGVEGAERKEDPLDFALWKAQKPGEDSAWDAPWGRGRPGWHIECSAMAESPRRGLRHPRRRGRPAVPPPRERGGADPLCARRRARVRVDAQRAARGGRRREDVEVGRQHHAAARGARRPRRDTLILYFASAPLPPADRLERGYARRRRRQRGADPRGGAPARRAAPRPQELRPLRDRFFAALADDFHTPEALAAMWEWIREANRGASGVGEATCARCSASWGWRTSSRTAARRRRSRARRAAPSRARGRRLRPGGRTARADRGARLVGSRHARRRLRARAAAVIVYGRNPVREALQGRRASPSPGSSRPTAVAREPWLASRRVALARAERRAGLRLARASGRLRRARRATRTLARGAARRRRAADRRARRGPGPPEPRGDLPYRRMRRCDGVVICERRAARSPRPSAGPRPAPSSICDRAGAQHRRLPPRGADARAAGATARRAPASIAYTEPDYAGGVVIVFGAEGHGLRRRVAESCDALVALPLRGAGRLAERQRCRRRAAVRGLAQRRALDSDSITAVKVQQRKAEPQVQVGDILAVGARGGVRH